jgi:hypothetical protein
MCGTCEVEGVQTAVNILVAIRGMSVFSLVDVEKARSLKAQNKTWMAHWQCVPGHG